MLLLLFAAAAARAAEPDLRSLDVRGLQAGGTTTVTVDGDNLGKAPRLLLPFAARQTLKPGSTDKKAVFDVAAAADVPAGYYHLRVATGGGVSFPVVVGVDRLPQTPLAAKLAALPAAVHGSVTGSGVAETTFTGAAGEKVFVEVEAKRLGSKLQPVAHLYGPTRLQLAWSWPTPALFGDTRLEATLPEGGTYTVTVHDAEYAAAAPSFFRLKVGRWAFADQAFPPVVGKDAKAVELLGSGAASVPLPGDRRSKHLMLPWPAGGTWSGPRPFVSTSPRPEVLDRGDGSVQDVPAGAVGVCGRLLAAFEEDRFRVPVSPGGKLRLEVFAERLGSPVDVALVVRDEKGAQLARGDDSPGTLDPVLDYTAPAAAKAVVVAVVDAQGRGGPRGVYRLTVDPVGAAAAASDFALTTTARRLTLTPGGRSVVPVVAERKGYAGPVELSAEGLPAGVKLEGTTIPAGADGTLVTVHHGTTSGDAALTRWSGKAADGRERAVVLKGHPLERLQPWLATELAAAPVSEPAEAFAVDWKNLPADAAWKPGGRLSLPVSLTRPPTASAVRLTLLTSQAPALNPNNNQPDPQRTIRVEKAVELAAKATDGELVAVVPADLPSPAYDVAVMAELLSANKAQVLATAVTPVRRLEVRLPAAVTVTGPARVEAKKDAKAVEVAGTVERRDGFAGDVTVTLAGLPDGFAAAAPVVVKAGATAFAFKLPLPAGAKPGEYPGVTLGGTAVPDAKAPNARVRLRETALTLVLP